MIIKTAVGERHSIFWVRWLSLTAARYCSVVSSSLSKTRSVRKY